LLSGYKEDVIQTITNESQAHKRGERRKCEKSERAKYISKDSNLSLFLFSFLFPHLIYYEKATSSSSRVLLLFLLLDGMAYRGKQKNEDFVSFVV
jgi:hypothetical protein